MNYYPMSIQTPPDWIAIHQALYRPAPELSVIVPAHNEAKSIIAIVEGIHGTLAATGRSYEILVVDDGSTDGTAEKAIEAGAKVIQHPYSLGVGAAIKAGVRNARGTPMVISAPSSSCGA
jgi:glycosyltransferase involved in cell wall biosynthesis